MLMEAIVSLRQGDKGKTGEKVRKDMTFKKHFNVKTNESKESLSIITICNLKGEVGPEGPAGPRVSYDWQTYKVRNSV